MRCTTFRHFSISVLAALLLHLLLGTVTAQQVEPSWDLLFDEMPTGDAGCCWAGDQAGAFGDDRIGPLAALGDAVTFTYSYSNLFDGTLDRAAGFTPYEMVQATEEALSLWASVTPITFIERSDSGPNVSDNGYDESIHPDIRIGHHDLSGNVLAHAYFPGRGGVDSDLHMDSSNRVWSESGFLTTITHELGHTIGLDHQELTTAVMNSSINGSNTLPGLGKGFLFLTDITAAQRRWGKGTGQVITEREWTGSTDDRWMNDDNWNGGWHPTKNSAVLISSDTTVRVDSRQQFARSVRLGVGKNQLQVDGAGSLSVAQDLVVGDSHGGQPLVRQGAPARTLVPNDASIQNSWFDVDFDDSSWTEGPTGIGFHQESAFDGLVGTDVRQRMYNRNGAAYTRIEFQVDDPSRFEILSLDMKYDDGFVAYLNGTKVVSANSPSQPQWNSTATAAREDDDAIAFSNFDLSEHAGQLRTGRNVLAIQGLNQRASSSEFLILPVLHGGKIENGVTVSGGTLSVGRSVRLAEDRRSASGLTITAGEMLIDGHVIDGDGTSRIVISGGTLTVSGRQRGSNLIDVDSAARWYVPSDGSVDNRWTAIDFDDSAWTAGKAALGYDREYGFSSLFQTDIESDMYNRNSSVYSRTVFEVDDPASFNQLSLSMKYDDGFVAFLNGHEVARANAPEQISWNSLATSSANEEDVRIPVEFDLTEFVSRIVPGKNVLSIQGLNRSRDSSDFVTAPQLIPSRIAGTITVDELVFNGGTIAGATLITSAFRHESGAFSPTGSSLNRSIAAVQIIGSYEMDPPAILEIDISGRSALEYDRLSVQGPATIDGTLLLDTGAGYTDPTDPGQFDRFDFLTAGSIDGTFESILIEGAPIQLGHQQDGLFRWLFYHEQSVSLVNYRAAYGDSNGDGQFNSADLVDVFQTGEYEDALPENSDWIDGDWDGDREFGSSDFVVAFQDGRYEQAPLFASRLPAVPEPSGLGAALVAVGLMTYRVRRRKKMA
jgi:hypothetical protein